MKEHDFYKEITDSMVADLDTIEKRCLQKKETARMKKHRTLGKRTIGIAAVVAVCAVLLCMPAMAKGLAKLWNDTVADLVGADEEIQEQYKDSNLTQTFGSEETKTETENGSSAVTTAENGGVTVTLTQTFADRYSLYVYLNVKTDGTIPLSDDHLFDKTTLYVNGEIWEGFISFGGGFVSDSYAVSDYERSYELIYLNPGGIHLEDQEISLKLEDLLADAGKPDMYPAAEGSWQLKWRAAGEYKGETKTIDLKDTKIDDLTGSYTLTSIEISPISYFLHYESENTDSFNEGPLKVAFIMKDGTIYNDETLNSDENMITGNGGSMGPDGEFMAFVKILNLSELEAVRINGNLFNIREN